MTAIAYKDGIMAGDGRLVETKSGGILSDRDVKVFKAGDYLLGVAGDADACEELILATVAGHVPGRLKGCNGLRADANGRIYRYEGSTWYRLYDKYGALGSGCIEALSAMDCGASAVDAVKQAMKRNAFCGGRITKVSL